MADFDALTVAQVWDKASVAYGGAFAQPMDPRLWRRDYRGNLIYYPDYGNRNSEYGWEIDHILPVCIFGTDDLYNLRPLHWRANASAGGGLASIFANR